MYICIYILSIYGLNFNFININLIVKLYSNITMGKKIFIIKPYFLNNIVIIIISYTTTAHFRLT